MKISKFAVLLTILAFAILTLSLPAGAVVNWTKQGQTNLAPGGSGQWDEAYVERPVVIKDGTTYRLWYTGENSGGTMQIGYATSTDGMSWTKSGSNPVLQPGASGGTWDTQHVGVPWVIWDGDVSLFKMWYAGTNDPSQELDAQIGYATSSNGTSWIFPGSTPVLPEGGANDWDGEGVVAPTVLKDNDAPASERYKMWYVGYNETAMVMGIGYAYSSDGISWTKWNDAGTTGDPYANSDPVLSLGPPGSWEDNWVFSPSVVKEGSVYRMWYDAESSTLPSGIGYAYSIDGISWRKYKGNPVVMEGDQSTDDFDEFGAFDPAVIKDGNIYKMWYTGNKDCVAVPPDDWQCLRQIGYATAPVYPGSYEAIEQMSVSSVNTPGGMKIRLAVIPGGAGPLDINELKVAGPNSFTFTFTDSNFGNYAGTQFPKASFPVSPVNSGTYTFSVKTNNGLSASDSLVLSSTPIAVPDEGGSGLDMKIKVGSDAFVYNNAYIDTTTPNFWWKPSLGTGYYYRVQVKDWNKNYLVYDSGPIPGTAEVDGYIDIFNFPAGVLAPNAPYCWHVVVLDSADTWTAFNQSVSVWQNFYTGTKGTADFIDWAKFRSQRDYNGGDRSAFGFKVINLAPWDIDVSTRNFSVINQDSSLYFDFSPNPGNNPQTKDPSDFYYWASVGDGIPADATTPGYTFVVTDMSANSDSLARTFQYVDLPRVSRKDMLPQDNAYLTNTTPTLAWVSKGAAYRYRIRIQSWNGKYFYYTSPYINGLAAGQTMSVDIAPQTLKEYSPYFWWLEVSDTNKNSRTRSQRLAFMTGAPTPASPKSMTWLLLLLGD